MSTKIEIKVVLYPSDAAEQGIHVVEVTKESVEAAVVWAAEKGFKTVWLHLSNEVKETKETV